VSRLQEGSHWLPVRLREAAAALRRLTGPEFEPGMLAAAAL